MKFTNYISNVSVEDRLRSLYELQKIHSKVDDIKKLKGELPIEVSDLEDELEGLKTRLGKFGRDLKDLESKKSKFKAQIEDSKALIERYQEQQKEVKNNREFDALAREVELQSLDIQLAEKRIRETEVSISNKKITIEATEKRLNDRTTELERKREELKKIIAKTEKEEKSLERKEKKARKQVEERLQRAYDRIRNAYRNGLAVVSVERNACGGCHNEIPPQVQLEIRQQKRIIVCEHCGRILINKEDMEAAINGSMGE